MSTARTTMQPTQPSDTGDPAATHPAASHDVAIVGAGSAAEMLVAELDGAGLDVVVFEAERVGGECPFVACIPSKAMLHDVAASTRWNQAVARRDELAHHLDDAGHANSLLDHGATLVRARARLVDEHTVVADGVRHRADHVVIATGATPVMPPIDGLDAVADLVWTSDDALVNREHLARLMIIGGGPIGCELAQIYAGFDTEVHLVDIAARAFPELPERVGAIIDDGLAAAGVRVSRGREVLSVERRGGNVVAHLDNGTSIAADRLLVTSGRRPRLDGIGIDALGLSPDEPLPVDQHGRVECAGSVWAIGDVAGRGQYTHLANHQARVVADHLCGTGSRRFDDVVTPACIYTQPPLMMIGPRPDELDDEHHLWVEVALSDVARQVTDELGTGHLAVAVDRRTRCVVAAHGAGARFDELAAALVTAIDGELPVDRLVRSMMPFPTVSELLPIAYRSAIDGLDD